MRNLQNVIPAVKLPIASKLKMNYDLLFSIFGRPGLTNTDLGTEWVIEDRDKHAGLLHIIVVNVPEIEKEKTDIILRTANKDDANYWKGFITEEEEVLRSNGYSDIDHNVVLAAYDRVLKTPAVDKAMIALIKSFEKAYDKEFTQEIIDSNAHEEWIEHVHENLKSDGFHAQSIGTALLTH